MTTNNNNKRRSYEEIMRDTLTNFVNSDEFKTTVRNIVKDELTKTETKKPTTSGRGKGNNKKEKDTSTWTEKKAEYASQFTEEQRKAYGEQKKIERANKKLAYEKTNEFFKDKGYVGKTAWHTKYNEILASLA